MKIAFALPVLVLRLGMVVGIALPASAQTFTEFPIPSHPGGQPEGITVGPDGALWFTEYTGNKIGRITTAGVITEFPTITIDSRSRSITTGPDGALWFTEAGASKIGRIPTTATPENPQLTEFPVPLSGPFGITTGPDHALWFTSGNMTVGRITTTGVFTNQFPGAGLTGITTGPDRALWIASSTTNYIVRMTAEGVAGVISRFKIPTATSGPWKITTGPDGALWFTEQLAGKIGRVATNGSMREFTLPKNALPAGITPFRRCRLRWSGIVWRGADVSIHWCSTSRRCPLPAYRTHSG
jgi:virginiamycin B lyase